MYACGCTREHSTGGVCTEAGDADRCLQFEQGRSLSHFRLAAMHAEQAFLGLPILLGPQDKGCGDEVALKELRHAVLIENCPSSLVTSGRVLGPSVVA